MRALRRGSACTAAAALAAALTACATAEPQIWSGPELPGVSGALPEALPRGVDARVVNGVAWVPSVTPSDSSWLWHRIDVLEVKDLSACLERYGVSPQRLASAARSRERATRQTVASLPDAAQVAAPGLSPHTADTAETRWTASERPAIERCRELNPTAPSVRARAAGISLRQAFEALVSGRPDPVLAEAQDQFARCMVRLGYPAEPSESPEEFLAWAARHRSDEDHRSRQVGADYVDCSQPVRRSTERARAAVRLAFVSERQAELRALTSLVLDA